MLPFNPYFQTFIRIFQFYWTCQKTHICISMDFSTFGYKYNRFFSSALDHNQKANLEDSIFSNTCDCRRS